jgi:endonuclease-3
MNSDDIHFIIQILRKEVQQWEEPVVGHFKETPFKALISCLLSLRTQDKTTHGASTRLFSLAQTPKEMLTLPVPKIERAIYPVGFYRTKAKNIHEICKILLDSYDGKVPDSIDELLKLPGVGRKTANLVITIGYNKLGICVDTHVHRISNRLGYVKTKTPEETEMALRKKLPERYWMEYNDLLVTYGQNLCKPISPFCSRCKIRPYCDRRGLTHTR